MYLSTFYKMLTSIYLIIYLYLIFYSLIIHKKNNVDRFLLNIINIMSVLLFLLGYRIYASDSIYIKNQSYELYIICEQLIISMLYIFILGLCKPYIKIDFKYRLYVYIYPTITAIAILTGLVDINFTGREIFLNYDIVTTLMYDNTILYTNSFYSLMIIVIILKLLLERISASRSYRTYYISFLILFFALIIYKIYMMANLINMLDLVFFNATLMIFINLIVFKYIGERNLLLSREYVFNKLSTAYVMVDNNLNIADYNMNFEKLFLSCVDKEDRTNLNKLLAKFKFEKLKEYNDEYIFIKETQNEKKYYVIVSTNLGDVEDETVGKLIEFIEITDKIELIKKQSNLLNIDELTGLYSRRYYYEVVEDYNKKEFLPVGFFSFDINNLKVINDTYGHKFGDKYLIANSRALSELLPSNSVIARAGGDEIIAIVPNCDEVLAKEIFDKVESKNKEITVKPYNKVDVSVGYALKTSLVQNSDDILTIADENMYIHKQKNKKGRK